MYTAEEKQWGMLAHIIPMIACFFSASFLGFVVAIIIYMIYKDKSKFIAYHALQQIFFQIAMFAACIVAGLLCFILIGIPLLFALVVVGLVYPILAGIAASNGDLYELPFVGPAARRSIGI